MGTEDRVSPSSNGGEFSRWVEANCDRCARAYDDDAGFYPCPIQEALDMASLDDGTVDAGIARRMGADGGPLSRRRGEFARA